MSALTKNQKAYLARLGRRALNFIDARARGRGENIAPRSTLDYDNWRHDQVARACGKSGLTTASQLDYKRIEAHFLELLGQTGRALNAQLRSQTERRRQATHHLLETIEKNRDANITEDLAAYLCKKIFKVELSQADPETIWRLSKIIWAKAAKRRQSSDESRESSESPLGHLPSAICH